MHLPNHWRQKVQGKHEHYIALSFLHYLLLYIAHLIPYKCSISAPHLFLFITKVKDFHMGKNILHGSHLIAFFKTLPRILYSLLIMCGAIVWSVNRKSVVCSFFSKRHQTALTVSKGVNERKILNSIRCRQDDQSSWG